MPRNQCHDASSGDHSPMQDRAENVAAWQVSPLFGPNPIVNLVDLHASGTTPSTCSNAIKFGPLTPTCDDDRRVPPKEC